jgi:hypothetical protein
MKKDFVALDKHITCKEDTVCNQKNADGFIMRNSYESKIANLVRQGK